MPALRRFELAQGRHGIVINNAAAGMRNFKDEPSGLLTRISVHASSHAPLYGAELGGVFIDSLQIEYDSAPWQKVFLANWPLGSDAHHSYFSRIERDPDYTIDQARDREAM